MRDTVFWAELAWPQVEERVKAGAPVFLPLGSTEQHGHHMSLNVDVVIPTQICERVARRTNGLVLPTVAYGNRSQPRTGGGPRFPGTINLSAHTFSMIVRDILCDLYRQGCRKIVVLNGHYENIWPAVEGIELALDSIGRRVEDFVVLRADLWELVAPETIARIFPDGFPGIELEHASVIETSLMMALRPELVDLTAARNDGPAHFEPYDRYPKPAGGVPASGVLSLTEASSIEKAEWLVADITTNLENMIAEEF
ncbi:creatininase [Rhizobium bangladeshense]|uniref:Creatininase n=1 Tax=Rhizobium bangladeshense TaxID=1138189 RepID=A0ABS7LR20_9HYPH|nr:MULTISPECIES: creatininase [Rhizobium]MBX4876580.1 creatininase [Rhizobium bangladeshense]MBX4887419.1 creatininase [Rhizobium bangladeshense]MBY3593924.1 creatininase [Rhizobium bangladeshense]MBY3599807.1 creatininase [Rhizobium bangladeshense]NKL23855.1 creatininase [Rhizobium leguminosarum bv. viciae]